MPELVGHHFLVHGVQPFVHLGEEIDIRLLGEIPFRLRKGNVDFLLFGKSQIDRKYLARLFPLRQARVLRPRGCGNIQGCRGLVHGRFITQSQGLCKKRTATALRPSWYCTASTVASARKPWGLASSRTRSPNSSGSVERKMAWRPLLYSTMVASRRFVAPPRGDVTCTGTRTALACGKKRASCSAQLFSFVASAEPPVLPTSP